jgi:hypothetical protein
MRTATCNPPLYSSTLTQWSLLRTTDSTTDESKANGGTKTPTKIPVGQNVWRVMVTLIGGCFSDPRCCLAHGGCYNEDSLGLGFHACVPAEAQAEKIKHKQRKYIRDLPVSVCGRGGHVGGQKLVRQ